MPPMSVSSPWDPPTSQNVTDMTQDPLVGLGLKALATVAFHPSEYACTLMQIGHEPIPPTQCKTFFFGKPALGLPSVFKYIGHIKRRDGFLGLYAGVTPRVLALGINAITVQKFDQYWPASDDTTPIGAKDAFNDEKERRKIQDEICRSSAKTVACAVATQPLTVISVRIMAQFVGGETKYNGVFDGILEILREDGILGFWKGLLPRCIGEVSLVCLTTAFTYFINRYIFTDKDLQKFTGHISSLAASGMVYPFTVVQKTMIVSRSGLAAGYPPSMPFYMNWIDCYRQLSAEKQLKRGSSMMFRYDTRPHVVIAGRAVPVNKFSGFNR